MADTARRAFVATLVAVAVIALALALWKVKIVIALVFLGLIIAAAMRPGVERLAEWSIPRAVGVGLTVSWHVALAAGIVVLVVRLIEDYLVIPRVMGHVTGLSPLLVLVGVTTVGLLFGGFYVLLATPLVAVLVTLLDVIVRDKDPADEEVPAVLFAKESQG